MAENSGIEWTDHTFNAWRGCRKKSPGCKFCYAESRAGRFGEDFANRRIVLAEAGWKKPLQWNAKAKATQTRLKVFCLSLGDVFEDWSGQVQNHLQQPLINCPVCGWEIQQANEPPLPDGCKDEPLRLGDVRRRLFALIDATPWLDWILVTKRPENIRRMWPAKHDLRPVFPGAPGKLGEPLPCVVEGAFRPNVWLLTSVENQEQADKRIPELLECRQLSPVLGLSCEPLLGPLELRRWMHSQELLTCQKCGEEFASGESDHNGLSPCCMREGDPNGSVVYSELDWIIAGGESGPNARPMHPDWARSLRDQCQAAEVPFFFKQWGEYEPWDHRRGTTDVPGVVCVKYRPDCEDPYPLGWVRKVGKKNAGRLLDGREWSDFPQVARQPGVQTNA